MNRSRDSPSSGPRLARPSRGTTTDIGQITRRPGITIFRRQVQLPRPRNISIYRRTHATLRGASFEETVMTVRGRLDKTQLWCMTVHHR